MVKRIGHQYYTKRMGRHGRVGSPTYISWSSMKTRVTNPRTRTADRYIHRGIDMDPRWSDFSEFLADMGERPAGTSLDRIDNNNGYWPDNCRWATRVDQTRNQARNVFVELNGERIVLAEALDRLGRTFTHYRAARWGRIRRTAQEAIDYFSQWRPRVLSTDTHCKNGHPWEEGSYYRTLGPTGRRTCIACTKAAQAKYRAKRKKCAPDYADNDNQGHASELEDDCA